MRGTLLTLVFCLVTGAALAVSVQFFDQRTGPEVVSTGLICEFHEICEGGTCHAATSAPFRIDPGPTDATLRVAAGDADVVARMDIGPSGLLIPLSGSSGNAIDLIVANDLTFSYSQDVLGTDGTPEQTAKGACIRVGEQ